MDTKNLKPLEVGTCRMDKYVRLVIPKKIRQKFADFLDTGKGIPMNVKLLPDGTIQLAPVQTFEISFYMESDSEILEGAAKAYIDGRENRYVPKEEIDKLLKD
jgi:hypothetical protein